MPTAVIVGPDARFHLTDMASEAHGPAQRSTASSATDRATSRRADGEHVLPVRRKQQRALQAFVRSALLVAALALPASAVAGTTTDDLRAQLRKERVQADHLRAELRAARQAARPSVDHAIHLAAKAFGVDLRAMRTVARCESTFNPYARNGKYLGLYQAGPAFWAATPFTAFDRTDPYANALATAMVVSREGWGQWSCKP